MMFQIHDNVNFFTIEILLILNEQSLTIVLCKINNESFDFCKHETENYDLNDYLLIQSLFTKIMLNENYKRLCSCSLTYIKIIFIMYLIINDNRFIISLSLYLIVVFNFFYNERDDFESEKNSSLKFKSKSF